MITGPPPKFHETRDILSVKSGGDYLPLPIRLERR
jgi:hypothetical protein